LPFIKQAEQNTEEAAPEPVDHDERTVEDAEFTEPGAVDIDTQESVDPYVESSAPELSFEFDPGEENGEEDLLK
jgi:hypothetical protein